MNFNLSLDDIIKIKSLKNKKIAKRTGLMKTRKNFFPRNIIKSSKASFTSEPRKKKIDVRDARLKILRNKEHLNSKKPNPILINNVSDARLKIEQQRYIKFIKPNFPKCDFGITKVSPDGIIQRKINATHNDNNVHVEYEDEDMNTMNEPNGLSFKKPGWYDRSLTIRRTVQNFLGKNVSSKSNDKNYYPRVDSPTLFYSGSEEDILSYKEVTRTISNSKKVPLNTIRKSYKKSSPDRLYNSYEEGEVSHMHLSPLSHTSVLLSQESGYRIVISDLHENVTGEDIKELFEDVGDLIYTKMIRNGMAEVAYKSYKDAVKAVEIYHNRQLDGLPMKCAMIPYNSDSSNSKKRNSGHVPPVNTFQSVEPDTRIIKKALFSN